MSRLGEWILRRLSHEERVDDPSAPEWRRGRELSKVCRRIPWFPAMVRGSLVLDFGCGAGYQAARMAELGARRVVGVEIQGGLREKAAAVAQEYGVGDRVRVSPGIPDEVVGSVDVILSQNAMEHFPEPFAVLEEMRDALGPAGRAVVVFGPLWWHPYGAHMHFFTKVPWPQIWFSEQTVMEVRSDHRDDGARRYEDVPGGLNRMSVRRFRRLVGAAGFEFDHFAIEAVKDVDVLTDLPLLRELAAKNVYAILRRPGDPC